LGRLSCLAKHYNAHDPCVSAKLVRGQTKAADRPSLILTQLVLIPLRLGCR
jgi:hypothetical protein